jgi:hypothetical protein
MNVMGDMTPHDDDVIDTNGRLDPANSHYVKLQDCGGMVLEEQPARMAEALRCFLQGLGFVTNLSVTAYSIANRNSEQAMKQREFLKKSENNGSKTDLNTVNLDIPYNYSNLDQVSRK